MLGKYQVGVGHASYPGNIKQHTKVFNTTMIGTFNIRIPGLNMNKQVPTIIYNPKRYYFVSIRKEKEKDLKYGWAIRDYGSNQLVSRMEVLTKIMLPREFKQDQLQVDLLQRWGSRQVTAWAKGKYWFQGFPFADPIRADSNKVWQAMNTINWSGKSVLDYGCNYGYYSFEASKLGANVVGLDKNRQSINMAKTIRDHIIQQDVEFRHESRLKTEYKSKDIIFYLSVHHQIDPNYSRLKQTIETLRTMAREHIFIELIMPPMFPVDGLATESEIDRVVGGTVLLRYKHVVRGYRKLYLLEV